MFTIRLRHVLVGTIGTATLAVAAAAPTSATTHPFEPADVLDCTHVMAGPCGHADYWPHGWPPPPPTSWPKDPL